MVRFIVEAKSKDCPRVPSIPSPSILPWKKFRPAFVSPRNRASVCVSVLIQVACLCFQLYSGWLCAQTHIGSDLGSGWLLGPHGCYGEKTHEQMG